VKSEALFRYTKLPSRGLTGLIFQVEVLSIVEHGSFFLEFKEKACLYTSRSAEIDIP
jgi:hypothetical protein